MDGQQPVSAMQFLAEGQTNTRRDSVVEARIAPEPLVFYRPHSDELLIVPADKAVAFENECRLLDRLAYEFHVAKENNLKAQEALLDATRAADAPSRGVPQDSQILVRAEEEAKKAENTLIAAQKKLEDEFKPLGQLDGSGGKLYELIPIRKRRNPLNGVAARRNATEQERHTWGRKWTYVRSDKVVNHFRSYKLNQVEQETYQSARNSVLDERGRVDRKKLKKKMSALEVSAAWKKEVGIQGTFLTELNRAIDQDLCEWADGINNGSDRINLEVGAQLLRYFAGAGIQTSWDPKKGKMAVRGDARAEFAIAEGKFNAAAYWPGRGGHMIKMTGPKSGKVHDAGLLRVGLQLQLLGLVGASASAQLGLEVDYSGARGDKAGIRGKPTRRPMSTKGLDLGREVRDGAEIGGAADLFAGARASGEIKGFLEWNSPEAQKFEALCKIGPGGQVQAGAGIAGQFKIDYVNGKFRVLASAAICLGVGAGGKLEFEIDPVRTLEFVKYLAYMLYSMEYEFLEILSEEAFKAWTNFSLWAVQTGKEISDAVENFGQQFLDAFDDVVELLEQEVERIQLMNRVLANPKTLEYAPPETKGMILYQLTRHGVLTKSLSANYDWDSLDTLGRRKRAVMTVANKARDKAEFRNICQHMTVDGAKDSKGWEANYLHLQRFLDMGIDTRDADGELREYFENNLAALYDRLYDQPVLGYPFVDNDAPMYAARMGLGHHNGYRVAGGYDPGPAMPNFLDGVNGNTPDTRYA